MKRNHNKGKKKGKLVVVDGGDGSGKATQVDMLYRRLRKQGVPVRKIDFPRYRDNFFGEFLRKSLDGKYGDFLALPPHIVSIAYAADRFESSPKIKKWLDDGYVVIVDRWVSANAMHQGSKIIDAKEREDFWKWLDTLEYEVFGIPRPDIIFYLNVPVDISQGLMQARAKERLKAGEKAFDLPESNIKHQLAVREAAKAALSRNRNWVKIECFVDGKLRTRQDVHKEIIGLLPKAVAAKR